MTALRAAVRGSLRVTAFWSQLNDPIANVTVSATPSLIVRERRNAGQLRSRGLEAEAKWRPAGGLEVFVTAGATDAVFSNGPEPRLEGKRVPQVPRYQLGGGMRVSSRRGFAATLELRRFGPRFEDDLNALPLGTATVVDGLAAQRLGRGFQLFVAVENLFDADYLVGRTPLPTIGAPRAARAGLRWTLP